MEGPPAADSHRRGDLFLLESSRHHEPLRGNYRRRSANGMMVYQQEVRGLQDAIELRQVWTGVRASVAKVLDPGEQNWNNLKGRSIEASFTMCCNRVGGRELAARTMTEWFGFGTDGSLEANVALISQYMAKRIKKGNAIAHPPTDKYNKLLVAPVLGMEEKVFPDELADSRGKHPVWPMTDP